MKKQILFALLLIFCSLQAKEIKETQRLVWPPAPSEAKIEYAFSFTKQEDLKIEKGFFTKIWEFFAGSDDRALMKPFGMHTHGKRIYVTDIGARALFVFDRKKKKMEIIEGAKEQRFVSPVDVDTDSKGNIYVSDSVLGAVYVFDDDGDFIRKIDAQIQRPTGIAVSEKLDRLYVVDVLASRIHIYSLKGKYVKSIGKHGIGDAEFNRPTYLTIGQNGDLYVADSMNNRVQILDSEGGFIRKFGQTGNSMGDMPSPRGIALDRDENIFVVDTLFNAIQIFNKNGELLLTLGSYGNQKGEFAIPEDITISDENDIYIADSYNMRVQALKELPGASK